MNIKNLFKSVFPFISTAASIGGPLGTMAAGAIGKALGIENLPNGADALSDLLAKATVNPEQLEKLKAAEQEFQLRMADLGFKNIEKLEEVAAADRASARQREMVVKDKTPMILALSVTGGFFSLLYMLAFHDVPMNAHDALMMMIGSLGTAFISIVAYYFGSSSGSVAKTDILAKINNK